MDQEFWLSDAQRARYNLRAGTSIPSTNRLSPPNLIERMFRTQRTARVPRGSLDPADLIEWSLITSAPWYAYIAMSLAKGHNDFFSDWKRQRLLTMRSLRSTKRRSCRTFDKAFELLATNLPPLYPLALSLAATSTSSPPAFGEAAVSGKALRLTENAAPPSPSPIPTPKDDTEAIVKAAFDLDQSVNKERASRIKDGYKKTGGPSTHLIAQQGGNWPGNPFTHGAMIVIEPRTRLDPDDFRVGYIVVRIDFSDDTGTMSAHAVTNIN